MRIGLGMVMSLAIVALVFGPADAGVSVSLQPAANHVLPDRLLNVYVYVDSAGSSFNAYETVIRWNPQVLQFVSAQPDTLYGEHNYDWWMPVAGPDSVLISHVILQGGMTVTGPGALSSITFRSLRIGQSPVFFEYIKFYRFGFDVVPVWSHDATVYVENPNSGAFDPPPGDRPRETVFVSPNPIEEESVLTWPRRIEAGAIFRLFDVDGRLLQAKRIEETSPQCRLSSVVDIHSLPMGPYFLEVTGADVRMRGRFVHLKE